MPICSAAELTAVARAVLAAAGTPDDIADQVARSLAEANLKGVDSHGVMRLEWYLEQIRDGVIRPAARPTVDRDNGATATMVGHGAFGIYAMELAADLAVERARGGRIAAVALVDVGHAGRLGQFAERIAGHGMLAMILGGGNHARWGCVVPHGGRRPILSTNPWAFALPADRHESVVVDFATSAVATGKLRLYRAAGKPVPEGWILDREGRPTTDAEDFFQGGMQLPFGGAKGSGLSVLTELIAEALLGETPREFHWLVVALDLEAFRPLGQFLRAADGFLDELKAVPPAEGFAEVMVPGEPERRSAAERSAGGIPVPDAVWSSIAAAARSVGLDAERLREAAAAATSSSRPPP